MAFLSSFGMMLSLRRLWETSRSSDGGRLGLC
jgi:hypothetical protein